MSAKSNEILAIMAVLGKAAIKSHPCAKKIFVGTGRPHIGVGLRKISQLLTPATSGSEENSLIRSMSGPRICTMKITQLDVRDYAAQRGIGDLDDAFRLGTKDWAEEFKQMGAEDYPKA